MSKTPKRGREGEDPTGNTPVHERTVVGEPVTYLYYIVYTIYYMLIIIIILFEFSFCIFLPFPSHEGVSGPLLTRHLLPTRPLSFIVFVPPLPPPFFYSILARTTSLSLTFVFRRPCKFVNMTLFL